MTTTHRSRHRRSASRGSELYGLLYPADCVRILALSGDPADRTRGLLTFDRDVAAAPAAVQLWAGRHRAFAPLMLNPRLCRVSFNAAIDAGADWRFEPSAGTFTAADGSRAAQACSGLVRDVCGPLPAGGLFVVSAGRPDVNQVDVVFSGPATVYAGPIAGLSWHTDDGRSGVPNELMQVDETTIKLAFDHPVPDNAILSIGPDLDGIIEAAEVMKPVEWRL